MALQAYRTPEQTEIDIETISRLLLQGKKAYEIVEVLNSRADISYKVNLTQVNADIHAMRKALHERTIDNINYVRTVELEKLSLLEAEAWKAWEISKAPKRKQESKSTAKTKNTVKYDEFGDRQDANNNSELTPDELQATVMEESSSGDPRHLEIVLKSMALRAKLLGLYAAKEDNVQSKDEKPGVLIVLPTNDAPTKPFDENEFDNIVNRSIKKLNR